MFFFREGISASVAHQLSSKCRYPPVPGMPYQLSYLRGKLLIRSCRVPRSAFLFVWVCSSSDRYSSSIILLGGLVFVHTGCIVSGFRSELLIVASAYDWCPTPSHVRHPASRRRPTHRSSQWLTTRCLRCFAAENARTKHGNGWLPRCINALTFRS